MLRPRNRVVYEPRAKFLPDEKKPPSLGSEWLDWVQIVKTDDKEHASKIGLDAVMFLRLLRLLAQFFTFLLVISLPLFLVNYFSTSIIGAERSRSFLVAISMQNIPNISPLFNVHVVVTYLISFLFYYMCYVLWVEYIALRKEHFATPAYLNDPKNRTLLLTEVPAELHDREKLRAYMENLGLRYQPKTVLLGRDFGELPKLVQEHLEITLKMEKVLTKCSLV